MEISGKTKIMFILADPVAHIRGSVVLTRELRALGHDIAISPLHVKPAAQSAFGVVIQRDLQCFIFNRLSNSFAEGTG